MENLLLGQEPAFPTEFGIDYSNKGMSKRFYAACAAMQGLMANTHPTYILMSIENKAHWAYSAADELLKQETKTE